MAQNKHHVHGREDKRPEVDHPQQELHRAASAACMNYHMESDHWPVWPSNGYSDGSTSPRTQVKIFSGPTLEILLKDHGDAGAMTCLQVCPTQLSDSSSPNPVLLMVLLRSDAEKSFPLISAN